MFANGISVGNFTQSFSFDNTFRPLVVHWDDLDGLDITYNGQTICTHLPTPGYVPAAGHAFAFSGRTGGATQGTYIDDLLISTVAAARIETGGPVISEFCADNEEIWEDENGDTSDWIEVYNGSATPANLAGYTLTDMAINPGRWTLPSVTVPAFGHLRIFASSKNRTDPAYPLHTDFSLAKEGGYLALFKPGGVLANEFNYGAQVADVSYGLLGNGGAITWGYLETPTPGSPNTGLQAAGPPAEDVVYLRGGVPATGGFRAKELLVGVVGQRQRGQGCVGPWFSGGSDWVLHAPSTDKCLMRNYIAYDWMRALNGNSSAMGVKFVEVFFNQGGGTVTESDYRGVHVLIERIKRDADRMNIEKLGELVTDPALISGGYIFRKDKPDPGIVTFNTATYGQQFQFVEPEAPSATQRSWLNNHVNAFESALAGSSFADPATGYAAYIDPRGFIDNQWWVEISKQIDGYRLSTYFHKDRNGKINAAPVWDYNLSFYNANYYGGDIHSGWYHSQLGSADYYYWPRLHQDANYRIRHWDRYWELRRGMCESNTILSYIDGLASRLVDAMKSFLKMRLEWIDNQNYVGTTIYRPPHFSLAAGSVEACTLLTISRHSGTAPSGYQYAAGGTLYFTLDGSDPRSGSAVPAGLPYSVPLALSESVTVRARLYDGVNWSPVTTGTYLVNAHPASAANLVISEICYKPLAPAPGTPEYVAGFTSGNHFEYVELLNVSSGDVDLAGCAFTLGITFNFDTVDPSKLILGPGERVLVVGNEQAFLMRYGSGLAAKVAGVFDGNLNNGGETVTLLAEDDSVIASVTYGIAAPWPVEAQTLGHSLLLDAAGPYPAYDAAAFLASAQPGGTPGASSGPLFSGNPALDADGDGFTDFLEYATGSAAGDPASAHRPVAGKLTVAGGGGAEHYLTFSYRRANAVDTVVYAVEFATDPGTAWVTGPGVVEWVGAIKHGDGTSTVTWRAAVPMAASGRQFLRLRVTGL